MKAGHALRLPVLMMIGALALGSGLLFLGLGVHATKKSELALALGLETEAARASREAPGKLRQDRRKAELYRHIQSSGFLGREDRAGWITALGQARKDLKLHSLSWRLSPRAPSTLMPGLWASAMDFTAGNLDTAGLEALLGHLRENAPGRFTVERCALAFNPDGVSGQAECRLLWWTWDDLPRPRD
jgi:hypothetical protein